MMEAQSYQPEDFIQITEVCRLTHTSRAGIYRGVSAKRFPARVKFVENKSLWITGEVHGWINDRVEERNRR
ncbi:MAG: helix-turn-helix transcriptional regulator [Minisyncoccota bacterium]